MYCFPMTHHWLCLHLMGCHFHMLPYMCHNHYDILCFYMSPGTNRSMRYIQHCNGIVYSRILGLCDYWTRQKNNFYHTLNFLGKVMIDRIFQKCRRYMLADYSRHMVCMYLCWFQMRHKQMYRLHLHRCIFSTIPNC